MTTRYRGHTLRVRSCRIEQVESRGSRVWAPLPRQQRVLPVVPQPRAPRRPCNRAPYSRLCCGWCRSRPRRRNGKRRLLQIGVGIESCRHTSDILRSENLLAIRHLNDGMRWGNNADLLGEARAQPLTGTYQRTIRISLHDVAKTVVSLYFSTRVGRAANGWQV
jgi:hypothetical protein